MSDLPLGEVRRRLLTGSEPVDEIAADAGFDPAEALEREHRRRLFLSPEAYRRLLGASELEIDLPPWLRRADLLAYWGRDPASASERVEGERISWAVHAPVGPLRIDARLGRDRAHVALSGPGASDPFAAAHAHAQAVRRLGLHLDPRPFEERLDGGPHQRLVEGRRGLSVPQTGSVFDAVLWVIAGQQVSLAAAFSIRRRLTERFGTEAHGLLCSPTASTVASADPEELHAHGLTRRKAEYLSGVARSAVVNEGELPTSGEPLPDLEDWRRLEENEAERQLLAVRGFGAWSVNYLLMRALGFPDRVPVGDAALARALEQYFQLDTRPNPEQTRALTAPFAPHRSLATFHLWASLAAD